MEAVSNVIKEEVWKSIAGYEGLYEVSDLGRVRSFHTKGRRGCKLALTDKGTRVRILAPFPTPEGYLQVTLHKGGRQAGHYVSRLVIAAFSGEPIVFSIDGNKNNLAAGNLRYGTRYEAVNRHKQC
jgi:hypothetical protein